MAVERLRAPRDLTTLAVSGLAVAFALLVGVGVGNQDQALLVGLCVVLGAAVVVAALVRPQLSFWVLLGTTVTQPFIAISDTRGVNPVDALLLPTLVGAWLVGPWLQADRSLPVEVARARRNLVRAVIAYFVMAIVSLIVLAGRGYAGFAGSSFLLLLRGFQGVLFFSLAERMLRTRVDLDRARSAIVVAFLVSAVVNGIGMAALEVHRAGAAWNILVGDYFISGPNEAGFGVVFLWAILLAIPYRRAAMMAILLLSLVFLAATSSRSGLVAWVTFVAVWAVQARKGWLLLTPLVLVALYPILPEAWTGKFVRTIFLQRGSFEFYSTVVRFYAWQTAVAMFLGFPLLGVGFVGFRFFSRDFNALTLNLGTCENFLLETATGLGIGGVLIVTWMSVATVQLGRAVKRVAPPGSRALALANVSGPFLLAVAAANMTGDNLIGMMGIAQVAVFAALLVASARIDTAADAARGWAAATAR